MKLPESSPKESCLSMNPEERLCPRYDEKGIALYQVGNPKEMGFIVVDNCTEEHIQ